MRRAAVRGRLGFATSSAGGYASSTAAQAPSARLPFLPCRRLSSCSRRSSLGDQYEDGGERAAAASALLLLNTTLQCTAENAASSSATAAAERRLFYFRSIYGPCLRGRRASGSPRLLVQCFSPAVSLFSNIPYRWCQVSYILNSSALILLQR